MAVVSLKELSNRSAAGAAEGTLNDRFGNLPTAKLALVTAELYSRGVYTSTTDFPDASRTNVLTGAIEALTRLTSSKSDEVKEVMSLLRMLEATTRDNSISLEALGECKQPLSTSQVLGLQGSINNTCIVL